MKNLFEKRTGYEFDRILSIVFPMSSRAGIISERIE